MKKVAMLVLAVGMLPLTGGCYKSYKLDNDWLATPAYSSRERFQSWQRGFDFDVRELNEDIDNTILLTGHPSRLTIWNVR